MVMALPVPPRRRGAWEGGREGGRERERSRALCTSHLGDEKNETAAEKKGEGSRGKRPNGVPFRINSPEWEEEHKKRERGREGEGALPTNVVFAILEL